MPANSQAPEMSINAVISYSIALGTVRRLLNNDMLHKWPGLCRTYFVNIISAIRVVLWKLNTSYGPLWKGLAYSFFTCVLLCICCVAMLSFSRLYAMLLFGVIINEKQWSLFVKWQKQVNAKTINKQEEEQIADHAEKDRKVTNYNVCKRLL